MDTQGRAENLMEAYRVLDPLKPLETEEDRRRWYVERPEAATAKYLWQAVEISDPEEMGKWLFTGHHGAGKTTELAGLARQADRSYLVATPLRVS